MLDIGAEAPDAGGDHLAAFRVLPDLARQGEKPDRGIKVERLRRQRTRQRYTLRLFAVAELDIIAVRPFPESDRRAACRIGTEEAGLARSAIAVALDGERSGVAAGRVVRTPDEGAEFTELQTQAPIAAHPANPRIMVGSLGEEVPAEIGVERIEDLRDAEILGAADRGREIAPEGLQHLAPGDPPAGDVIELVLEIGGEIVLDIALEEIVEEGSNEAAAILGHEAFLIELHIVSILEHLEDRGIGRRPADAELLEPLHQTCFGEARRRLGEMLERTHPLAAKLVALLERRQAAILLIFLGIVAIL